ncbi:efflux RND transporter periplasmic adaptor subunit [Bradyrhizobium sp.]|uniref:efflux RND transporter periplasmic adaptor subunit n=1 Tax=Bradyrhizobium sp. TaxID=376 RepID=UPI003C3DB054
MNEHTIPTSETSRKLAPFSANTPIKRALAARRLWLVAGAAILGVVAVVGAAWWASATRGTVRYATSPVTRGIVARAVTATGTVNPELTIIVGAAVSGIIQELYCDYNTQVKKGQVCAKLDPRPYQTVVDQNKADLAVAKAQLEKDKANAAYTKLAFERYANLIQTHATSQDIYDNAKNSHDQAVAQIAYDEATIQLRQAALDAAQVNLDYASIVSPVDGTVVSRNVTVGQTVASSFQTPTLFLIATDLAKMEVDANVSESDIGGIKPGNKATFTVDAYPKRIFEGAVNQVRQSPQTVQNVVTYDIVIGVDNSDLALRPGLTAASRIVTDERKNVMRVPNQALRYSPKDLSRAAPPDHTRVWVLRNDAPVAIAVATGLEDDSFTEIVNGDVKPGDLVITGEQLSTVNKAVGPRL